MLKPSIRRGARLMSRAISVNLEVGIHSHFEFLDDILYLTFSPPAQRSAARSSKELEENKRLHTLLVFIGYSYDFRRWSI